MSRYNPHENTANAVYKAAEDWRDRCLLGPGSVFDSGKRLWTKEVFDELDQLYVQNLDAGDGDFYEKLEAQLVGGSPPCKQLMAELHWVLLLFASRISAPKKRQDIRRVWSWSGETLREDHPLLADDVLGGIGHTGTAYNTQRWREFVFMINAMRDFKAKSADDQARLAASASEFVSWLTSIKDGGNRQLRHILSHLIFPDDFERISTIRDKHAILAAFEKAPLREVRKRDPGTVDTTLKALRERLEAETGKPIDFYEEGTVERWKQAPDNTVVVPPKISDAASAATVNLASSQSLNTILYGPPGTGKTYETAMRAVLICDGKASPKRDEVMKRYDELYREHRIEFVTFHQSYSYEEFVEGLRPETGGDKDDPQTVKSAGFRLVAKPGVLKRIAERAQRGHTKPDRQADYLRSTASNIPHPPHVLIIDEINRANISKVLGELITLLEEDKRTGALNELTVTLPYSGDRFSLPANLHIVATMNTADRSIALLDTALRRRFRFEELPPRPEVLSHIIIDGIGLDSILEAINKRLEWYLGSDHLIGHGYFTSVVNLEQLDEVIANKIIPLLREYFHEDLSRVRTILGGGDAFLRREKISTPFGVDASYEDERFRYIDTYLENEQYGREAYNQLLGLTSGETS